METAGQKRKQDLRDGSKQKVENLTISTTQRRGSLEQKRVPGGGGLGCRFGAEQAGPPGRVQVSKGGELGGKGEVEVGDQSP